MGSGGVTALTNGNYVVASPNWSHPGSGDMGQWYGGHQRGRPRQSTASSAISVVLDQSPMNGWAVNGVTALSKRQLRRGQPRLTSLESVTWGSGTAGVSGFVNATTSLVGSMRRQHRQSVGRWRLVGGGVTALANGNYVVDSPYWSGGKGAATWGNGATGIVGVVSAANSLVGSTVTTR